MRKILFCIFLAIVAAVIVALTCFEQEVPRFLLDDMCDRLSGEAFLVRVDSATLRFPKCLRLYGLRVLDRHKAEARPVISAARVEALLSLRRLPWSASRLLESLTIEELRYPRLPDGYYIPDSIEFPGQPDFRETDSPLELVLPELAPFRVTLLSPHILGIDAQRVDIGRVKSSPTRLDVSDLHLTWPDTDASMSLDGGMSLDLSAQRVSGGVHGQARQANIRPMLTTLEITNSYQFIDGFTGVTTPVDAGCRFDVNLRNGDLRLFLDLNPSGGAYHGVEMKRAGGQIDLRVFVRDTYQNAHIVVGPIAAELADGTMKGSIIYENTNDIGYVSFDVDSNTTLSNALAVADVMNDGTLDCLQPETDPHVTLRGRLAVNPAYAAANDIAGTVSFARGTFFTIPLRHASVVFNVKGTTVDFLNAHASSAGGGDVDGTGRIEVPEFSRDKARFQVSVTAKDVPLKDLTDLFGIESTDRSGRMFGNIAFDGPLNDNMLAHLNGKGRISCMDGHLAQMKLFAGLTDYLAKNVPGVAALVNQSSGSADIAITNGVLKASNLLIEGRVFSIHGNGSYDMVNDNIDFTARLQLFRNDSILAALTTPITWPFSKLLLEFKVYGRRSDPKWKYISVLERLK